MLNTLFFHQSGCDQPWPHCHTIGWLAGFLFKKTKKNKKTRQSVLSTDFLCGEFLSPWNYIKNQPLKTPPPILGASKFGFLLCCVGKSPMPAEMGTRRRKAHWLFDHDLEAVSEKSAVPVSLFIRQPNEFLSGRGKGRRSGWGMGWPHISGSF